MKFLRNVNGFSLIEGMVAAAVLAVGVSAITLYIVQSTKNTVALQGNSLCSTRSQMIIQTFENGDNKANISNWVYSGGTNLVPTLTSPFHSEIAMYGIVVNTGAPTANPIPISSPSYTNGWELIDNGTNWALSLVKGNSQYCQLTGNQWGRALGATTASFGIYSGQQLAPPPSTLAHEVDYLNIELVDKTVSPPVYSCPGGYQRVEPLSFQNKGDVSTGSNLSVQVTGTVTYIDNNQVQRACQATTTLKPGGDSTPPAFKSPLGAAPFLMSSGALVYCGTGAGVGNGLMCVKAGTKMILPAPTPPAIACDSKTDLQVAFQSSEAGSVFGCDLEYAATETGLPGAVNYNNTYVCGQGSYSVGGGGLAGTTSLSVTPFLGPATSGSGEMVTLTNAPDGFYRLFVTIYDSAQNYTTQSIDFGVDNSRPGAGFALVAPTPFMATFNGVAAATRGHLPVAAPWNTAVSFGTDLFQCQDSLATDTWSVTGGETVPVATAGAVWSYTKNGGASIPLSGTNCVATMRSPAGLVDGTYVMKGYACDACGMATPTPTPATQTWYVDEAPAPTPGHSPTTAPASDFGTAGVPFPSWSLSVAKPVPDLYEYACQNYLPNATFSSQTATCTPTGFVGGQSCTSQGSKGFSTIAFDGCGRNAFDPNTPYEIMAGLGQSCCNVPCRTDINLICSMDNSASRGTCINKTGCALDSDCGAGGTCYLPMGICNGGGSGPAPQTCGAAVPTPSPAPTPTPVGTPVATPAPSPGCLPTNTVGPNFVLQAGQCTSPIQAQDVFGGGWSPPLPVISIGSDTFYVGTAYHFATGTFYQTYPFTSTVSGGIIDTPYGTTANGNPSHGTAVAPGPVMTFTVCVNSNAPQDNFVYPIAIATNGALADYPNTLNVLNNGESQYMTIQVTCGGVNPPPPACVPNCSMDSTTCAGIANWDGCYGAASHLSACMGTIPNTSPPCCGCGPNTGNVVYPATYADSCGNNVCVGADDPTFCGVQCRGDGFSLDNTGTCPIPVPETIGQCCCM